eukprot:1142273-Pelagomonas_calceolata.AAC.4
MDVRRGQQCDRGNCAKQETLLLRKCGWPGFSEPFEGTTCLAPSGVSRACIVCDIHALAPSVDLDALGAELVELEGSLEEQAGIVQVRAFVRGSVPLPCSSMLATCSCERMQEQAGIVRTCVNDFLNASFRARVCMCVCVCALQRAHVVRVHACMLSSTQVLVFAALIMIQMAACSGKGMLHCHLDVPHMLGRTNQPSSNVLQITSCWP